MTLFSLARKNIQRNLSNYFLYIASMVFSIVIYFTFVTLKYNDDLSALKQSSQQIKGLMTSVLHCHLYGLFQLVFYEEAEKGSSPLLVTRCT